MNARFRLLTLFCCVLLLISAVPPALAGLVTSPALAARPPSARNGTEVTAIAFSPDGATLASGHDDSRIVLWNATTGQQRQTILGHLGAPVTGLAFSPDGRTLASVGRDSVVRLWDVATGQQRKELHGHEQPVRAVAFSPDGSTLATVGEDTRTLLWEVASGTLRQVLPGHRDFVTTVAFSPDGKSLATSGDDGQIILRDAPIGRQRSVLRGHAGKVTGVAFSPDGKTLASVGTDTVIRLWDVATGQQRQELRGHAQPIRGVAFRSDGSTLATVGEDTRTILWDIASGRLRHILQGHRDFVTAVAFSPDGKSLADGGDDGQIDLWDAPTGRRIRSLRVPPGTPGAADLRPDQSARDLRLQEFSSSTAALSAATAATLSPNEGPGGPILVIRSPSAPIGNYYAEILRNEGFNAFAVADISSVSSATLSSYDVVILAEMTLTAAQVTMLSDWVNGGGNLIAMRPDKQLASLLGLTPSTQTLSDGYLLVDTSAPPGSGIVGQTIQFHGTADRYTVNGAGSVATLYTDASTATGNPAVTLRSVGSNGGHAAAFTFDLARSIVYLRQGNPSWAGQERDGFSPMRSDDLYFGAATGDPQPDWTDLNKALIPQADEQQRLLANLITHVNLAKKPLPRFWYFPFGKKAVVVMTGDDHGNGGTIGRFDQYIANSPSGCSVENWECIRATSYVYPSTPVSDSQAAAYAAQGFEIALHVNTNCQNYTPTSVSSAYTQQLGEWRTAFPSLPAPTTNRTHCIVWSDWATQAKVELNNGIRLDTTYYYWPPSWVANRPGFFNGSSMPMRFADVDGSIIDVYLAATPMTDESGQDYPFTIDLLLDNALGAPGYYGAFVVNAHTDSDQSSESDAVVASARARGVSIISSRQLLTWLDGRNSSTFGGLSWNGGELGFTIAPGVGANGLQTMVPTHSASGTLASITRNGTPVAFSTQVIKGIDYAFFSALEGSYVATYATDTTAPTVTSTSPANGATGVNPGASITATFSEPIDPNTVDASTFELRDPNNTLVPAAISYDTTTRTATLRPSSLLLSQTTYTATVKGGTTEPRVKDLAGNALQASHTWSFTTTAAPACPCSIWSSSATPAVLADNDPNPVELGVKFRSDVDGYITGIRFYKGSSNTGTHTGNLWSSTGELLARATFTNETASGWQQVTFASPVPITANTTYVASYHTTVGRYSHTENYFATGADNAPLHAPSSDASGGNGVYRYSAASTFPNQTYLATNYWVDVVFSLTPSTTPSPTPTSTMTPTVTATATSTPTATPTVLTSTTATPTPTATTSGVPATSTPTPTPSPVTPTATLAATPTPTATVTAPACPCSIWSSSATPAIMTDNDPNPVELGVKFRSDVDGYITGIRFYKGPNNTGTHTGNLWSSTGELLARATFTNETTSGWQEVTFANPVPITANTTYVASYHTTSGLYSTTENYFTMGVDNAPLRALASAGSGGNGVYRYSATSAFPNQAYLATNYWVDVVFVVTPPATSPTSTPTPTATPPPLTLTPTPTTTPLALTATPTQTLAAGACASPANSVVAENCLPGNPASEWDVDGAGDPSIQGFATDISVNRGDTISFKVDTDASDYRLDIYRLGYYGGLGARKVATVQPSATLPQTQPQCLRNTTSGLIDCGNWAVSASWAVPANATSGVYIAKLVRTDTGGASHIVFVVRDDASRSDLLFQTSDTTWQAYNDYGGNSLYSGGPGTNPSRAYKVSYNRPFNTRSVDNGQDWLFNAEYPMIRWLEANGYDVTYFTGVDSDRRGDLIKNHKIYLSVGHDEYWSGGQRANVEAARDAGVSLAFFSGNEIFWKTRWESSIDGSNIPYRTLVSYKETHADAAIDPANPPIWTGTWRDPRFSPPADGGRPENAVSGTLFMVNDGATTAIRVPADDGKMRFWRNTSIYNLAPGSTATLANSTLGYEWDLDVDNGFRPAGLFRLSTTTVNNAPVLQDYGSTYSSETATHSLTLYRHPSGALVFGAGTVQWSWGLDSNHDRGGPAPDPRMQQATVNLFADMGVQPATLQPGLVSASQSTDTAPPASTITSPTGGTNLPTGTPVTITGTATDTGGGVVGGVEVSVDDGATWHPATGRANWSYTWTPAAPASTTIRSRAVDDSGNLETPTQGVAVTIGSQPATATSTPTAVLTLTAMPSTTVIATATLTLVAMTETPTPTSTSLPPTPTATPTATA